MANTGLKFLKNLSKGGTILAITACVLLSGCSDGKTGNSESGMTDSSQSLSASQSAAEAYYFEANGLKIALDAEAKPIITALGEPLDYFEAPSCAFDGMDKIYTYPGFELHVYTGKDADRVYSVLFTDDSVSTREGIALAATKEAVTKAYGAGFTQENEQYTYAAGDSLLSFLFENGEVASIEYELNVKK